MAARKKTAAPDTLIPLRPAPRQETFRILARAWDVGAMNVTLDAHPEQVLTMDTQKAKGDLYGIVTIVEDRLDTLENPDRPIIMLGIRTKAGVGRIVADGNHRLERALKAGQANIEVFIISADDEPNYRLT